MGDFSGAEPIDYGISDARQNLRCVAGSHAGAIFAERFIPNPVQPIFDAPVPTPPLEQLGSVGLLAVGTGDGVLHFGRGFSLASDGSHHATDLLHAGPIQVLIECGAADEMPMFHAAMPLAQRVGFRTLRPQVPLLPGGKSLRHRRRPVQCLFVAWVDCP